MNQCRYYNKMSKYMYMYMYGVDCCIISSCSGGKVFIFFLEVPCLTTSKFDKLTCMYIKQLVESSTSVQSSILWLHITPLNQTCTFSPPVPFSPTTPTPPTGPSSPYKHNTSTIEEVIHVEKESMFEAKITG